MTPSARDLFILLDGFLQSRLTAQQFQDAFLEQMKGAEGLASNEFEIMDALFADVDAYCADPVLKQKLDEERPNWYLDEAALRRVVQHAFQQLIE